MTLLEVVCRSLKQDLCIKRFCTTCGCRDFRAVLQALPDLDQELQHLDIAELLRIPDWSEAIHWAFLTLATQPQRDKVLLAWTPQVPRYPRFADHLIYYTLSQSDLEASAGIVFLRTAIEAAVDARDVSLTETIVWRLGRNIQQFPELLAQAVQLSGDYEPMHNALATAGFCKSRDQNEKDVAISARRNRESERATRNIFGAIRRNDRAAVRALLGRQPNLAATNQEGQTAAEYASVLGSDAIFRLIEQARTAPPTENSPRAESAEGPERSVPVWTQFFGNRQ